MLPLDTTFQSTSVAVAGVWQNGGASMLDTIAIWSRLGSYQPLHQSPEVVYRKMTDPFDSGFALKRGAGTGAVGALESAHASGNAQARVARNLKLLCMMYLRGVGTYTADAPAHHCA